MKKILCFLLSILSILSFCGSIPAMAAEEEKAISKIEYVRHRKSTATEFTYGEWRKDDKGNNYYYYFDSFFYGEPSDKFIIYYMDGSTITYTCKECIKNDPDKGRVFALDFQDTQGNSIGNGVFTFTTNQEQKHWLVGTHYITLQYKEYTCQIPMEITATGWIKENGKWYYYQNGDALKYFHKIKNKSYYFNSKGTMMTGWFKGKKWYYADPKTGVVATGWRKLNGKWYLFKYADCSMITGWSKYGGNWYYLNSDGAMATGWKKDKGIWYYLDTNGRMIIDTARVINGKSYQFNHKGECLNP